MALLGFFDRRVSILRALVIGRVRVQLHGNGNLKSEIRFRGHNVNF